LQNYKKYTAVSNIGHGICAHPHKKQQKTTKAVLYLNAQKPNYYVLKKKRFINFGKSKN
jgi:hypothetical protein